MQWKRSAWRKWSADNGVIINILRYYTRLWMSTCYMWYSESDVTTKKLTNGQYYMFDIVDCITAAITQLTFERTFIMTIPLYTGKLYRIWMVWTMTHCHTSWSWCPELWESQVIIHRVKWRHISVVAMRSPFCRSTHRTVCSYIVKICRVIRIKLNPLV